jgi:hypothetical protein
VRTTLRAHPSLPAPALTIEAEASRAGDRLELRYVVTGAVGALFVPALADSARRNELWKRTCFEAFVQPAGGDAYVEINLSPSRQWATYRFDRYREGMRDATDVAPGDIEVSATADALTLSASIPLVALSGAQTWRTGLTAVIETTAGTVSYWSLAHPRPTPEFHDADGFALDLRAGA